MFTYFNEFCKKKFQKKFEIRILLKNITGYEKFKQI